MSAGRDARAERGTPAWAGRLDVARGRWRRITALGLPPGYPIAQVPNGPAIVALLASLLRRALDGQAASAAYAVFLVALVVWAWEELSAGVNVVRRLLGAGALLYAGSRILEALG